jgi:hypothetical protein
MVVQEAMGGMLEQVVMVVQEAMVVRAETMD